MLNVAATVTGIVLFNTVVSLIGHTLITDTVYSLLFTYVLPSSAHKQQASLKRDILVGRRELRNTSAQDEFSKWAKIRRRVDKLVADLEALNNSLASHKSSFNKYSKFVLFILTSGLQWYFTTRHSKSAIVYLPKEWFGPLSWFLGLPFAPAGALSCGVYIFLVKRVMGILTKVTVDVWTGIKGNPSETPVAVPVAASGKAKSTATSQEKKEL